jgi:hypothetical protein
LVIVAIAVISSLIANRRLEVAEIEQVFTQLWQR